MSDELLHDLARRAGIDVDGATQAGRSRVVGAEILRRILAALGLPADTSRELSSSRRILSRRTGMVDLPPLVTGIAGRPIRLDIGGNEAQPAKIILESGEARDVSLLPARGRLRVPAIAEAGYHQLQVENRQIVLAIAPARCRSIDDVVPDARLWGVAADTYALRAGNDYGIGDSAGVAALAETVAQLGADALGITPSHALYVADPSRGSPSVPSTRFFHNPLHASPALVFGADFVARALEEAGLNNADVPPDTAVINWPVSATAKLAMLQAIFDGFLDAPEWDGALGADFARFRADGGTLLRDHACFEALHRVQMPRGDWREWPSDLRDPRSAAVAGFADARSVGLLFHTFLQWLTDRSMEIAQVRARAGGMRIGLIGELAIGVDPAGSHAWSRQSDMLLGVTIGMPPDRANPKGRKWGITSFSPRALELGGFAPFIATLRTAMRRVGGVRLDHATGLTRLWMVPEGVEPTDGAWLSYPTVDLLRLLALESTRHNAVVIADDLGDAPTGFADLLEQVGVHETRVLWSQRAPEGRFAAPRDWSRNAVAMTSGHDTPTVASAWRGEPCRIPDQAEITALDHASSDAKRFDLWHALVAEAVADGPPPPPDKPDAVVDAALRFVARTEAPLCLIPVEDFLADEMTSDDASRDDPQAERRRLPLAADAVFRDESVKRRALAIARERPRQ